MPRQSKTARGTQRGRHSFQRDKSQPAPIHLRTPQLRPPPGHCRYRNRRLHYGEEGVSRFRAWIFISLEWKERRRGWVHMYIRHSQEVDGDTYSGLQEAPMVCCAEVVVIQMARVEMSGRSLNCMIAVFWSLWKVFGRWKEREALFIWSWGCGAGRLGVSDECFALLESLRGRGIYTFAGVKFQGICFIADYRSKDLRRPSSVTRICPTGPSPSFRGEEFALSLSACMGLTSRLAKVPLTEGLTLRIAVADCIHCAAISLPLSAESWRS